MSTAKARELLRDELVDEAHADAHFAARHRRSLRGARLRVAHDVRAQPLQVVERAVLAVQRDQRREDRVAGAARHRIGQLDLVAVLGLHEVRPAARRGELLLREQRRVGAEADARSGRSRRRGSRCARVCALRPRRELGEPRRPIRGEQALGRALQERIDRAAVPDVGLRDCRARRGSARRHSPVGLRVTVRRDAGVALERLRRELAGVGIVAAVERRASARGAVAAAHASSAAAREPAPRIARGRGIALSGAAFARARGDLGGAHVAASLSSTPLTNLWPSVPPYDFASSTASLITTRYGISSAVRELPGADDEDRALDRRQLRGLRGRDAARARASSAS